MTSINRLDPSACQVAAVCGSQVRIYGPLEPASHGREIRRLMRVINFGHRGHALRYAIEHDDRSCVPPSTWRAK